MRITDLRALRDKYEQMLHLRLVHLRAKSEADFVEPDPRPIMAELARAFPGALRELDELPLDVIRSRIEELAIAERAGAAELAPGSLAPWMTAHARFHALARGALRVKLWLAGRSLTRELEEGFEVALAQMTEAERAVVGAWSAELAAIAKPPRGRVMDLVYARLARELGLDIDAARARIASPRS